MKLSDDLRMDLRKARTDVLVAQIMHVIGDYICVHGERDYRREILRRLYNDFYNAGVEVVTDVTRAEMGLPPRDEKGWTPKEFVALEQRRLEVLLRPIQMVVPKDSLLMTSEPLKSRE